MVVPDPELDDITPKLSISLSSKEKLEVTVTKTCLEVCSQLGEAFANAVKSVALVGEGAKASRLCVKNDTGVKVILHLNQSELMLAHVDDEMQKEVEMPCGGQLDLSFPQRMGGSVPGRISYSNASSPISPVKLAETYVAVSLSDLTSEPLKIPLDRTGKRYFSVNDRGVVADVTIGQETTTLTLRSVVLVQNHFLVPINVHYMTKGDKEVELIGSVPPRGFLNIPLHAVYTRRSELFFSVDGYCLSQVPFVWKDLQRELNISTSMRCEVKNKENVDPFFIKCVGELEQVYFENTNRHTMASLCYNIHLQPTVELINSLPTGITLAAQGGVSEVFVAPGNTIHIPHADPGSSTITLRMSDYLEKEWSCRQSIPANPPEFFVWCFESFDSIAPVRLNLGVHSVINRGTVSITMYCPFWMINKTGHFLSYKFDDGSPIIYHPDSYQDPMMFSPTSKKFLGKKKGSVKVGQGDWSDKFSLDVAGSAGLIQCKENNDKNVALSINIQLTNSSLTKLIIFTPAYVVVNKTHFVMEVREVDIGEESEWISVASEDCSPLWPVKGQNSKLTVRIQGTEFSSPAFPFHSTYSCLLKINNKYGGILVDVQCTAGGYYINLFPYQPGVAPALVINTTSVPVILWEKEDGAKVSLSPGQQYFHAWETPAATKSFSFKTAETKAVAINLNEDTSGTLELLRKTESHIKYVSFLDGMQRVLLMTEDKDVVKLVLGNAKKVECADQEITINLHGIGISVVNNIAQTELIYIGLVSSAVIWETSKIGTRRCKPMSARESEIIEKAYMKYVENEKDRRDCDPIIVIDNKIKVNLETMMIEAPNKRDLHRRFEPGLFVCLVNYPSTTMLHGKVNRLQIDNQMLGCIFPVILAPVPPPKTVAAGQGPKPFIELSIVKRVTTHSTVQQYKYFKILVQEFHIKLDIKFVNAMLEFFEAGQTEESVAQQRFFKDVSLSRQPLISHISVFSSQEQKNFYDQLHFSPLKIHLSLSLAGNVESKSLPQAMSVLLQGLGVTLTDISDAVFRLSYFERQNAFLTMSQLQGEATSHYLGQALRQAYVIVLGLDVIGNPYGLVVGIGEGVEALFYEPFQGIIQGPAEFAEGLGLGVKSLFGHTVGGAAGAFSRITDTLGKGLAVLSLDKEYQQERLDKQNRRPENLQASMAQGGMGLVMGVVEGVSGVVTKPISGAKEEGVGGFFKGVGKGVMGLMTRPVTGVVDFASTSLNVVKRATEQGEEITRLRPPRLLRERLVTPYRDSDARGSSLLNQLDNRRFSESDVYQCHFTLCNGDILLLTNKRIIIATMSDVFNTWQVNLTVTWRELTCPPTESAQGVLLSLERRKSPSIFGAGHDKKTIPFPNIEQRKMVLAKILDLYSTECLPPR